jgi:hypothetical protein
MPAKNLDPLLGGHKGEWYKTERNTAVLLKAILASRPVNELSGDDIWNLLRLTWITLSKGQPSPDHWKRLKIPSLAALWNQPYSLRGDLKATVEAMQIPALIRKAASLPTGMVNFRNVWRKSSRKWCHANRDRLADVIHHALELKPNQSRLAVAKKIDNLPGIPSPANAERKASPAVILTPLIACLDPGERFPVINGREGVNRLLKALHLSNRSFEDQVKGMVGLIGQFGVSDSFMIDVLADDIAVLASKLTVRQWPPRQGRAHGQGKSLPTFDDAEREFVQKSGTVVYRNRHNKMTNALKHLFKGYEIIEGTSEDCRFDVLIKKYDRTNRDLLVEVKPDPDRGLSE